MGRRTQGNQTFSFSRTCPTFQPLALGKFQHALRFKADRRVPASRGASHAPCLHAGMARSLGRVERGRDSSKSIHTSVWGFPCVTSYILGCCLLLQGCDIWSSWLEPEKSMQLKRAGGKRPNKASLALLMLEAEKRTQPPVALHRFASPTWGEAWQTTRGGGQHQKLPLPPAGKGNAKGSVALSFFKLGEWLEVAFPACYVLADF